MPFDDLMQRIESPRLRAVARHWNDVRGARRMPGWSDIDPAAIARQLPIVWAWIYDRAADRFTGRLAGEEINAAFGKSLRGADMAAFFRDFDYETVVQRYRRIVNEPCFFHGGGQVLLHAGRVGFGERVILPLAADGETADGLFGATLYAYGPSGLPDPMIQKGQVVTFIPLA